MISNIEYIRHSLELHLFFSRIMKEHSFFLQIGFTPKDSNLSRQAVSFRIEFDRILSEVISLSNGVISEDVLKSGEVITPYTLRTEMATTFFTGVPINTALTKAEQGLSSGVTSSNPTLEYSVLIINQKAMVALNSLIRFKSILLSQVLSCKIFTNNTPY